MSNYNTNTICVQGGYEPKDHGMVDIILGVVSIGLLFLIQRYLISKKNDISSNFKDDDDEED